MKHKIILSMIIIIFILLGTACNEKKGIQIDTPKIAEEIAQVQTTEPKAVDVIPAPVVPTVESIPSSVVEPAKETIVPPTEIVKANNPNEARIVYWTPNGKSYHYNKNCSTLSRSKVIEEGSLSSSPKSDPCNICVK